MMTLFYLAQAQVHSQGLGEVPADFVKWFVVCSAFFAGLYFAYRKGQQGGKADPLHIDQPLAITRHPEYAPKRETRTELDAIKADINARYRECMRVQDAAAKEVTQRLDVLSQAGAKRGDDILKEIHAMEGRITQAVLKEVKDLHNRINPLAENVKGHATAIESLQTFVEKIWAHIFKTKR
jgi:gas vesicle protein